MTISSGVAMEIHYCMGKKAGIDLYGFADEKCGKCGMKENKSNCCFDEHKFYKLTDSHQNITNNICLFAIESTVITEFPLYSWHYVTKKHIASLYNHPPPDDTGPSPYILNCVFRL